MKHGSAKLKWVLWGTVILASVGAAIFVAVTAIHNANELQLRDRDDHANSLVNPDGLRYLLDKANQSNSSAIVILKDGQLVGTWNASSHPQPIEAMSATKSVVSLIVGRAIKLGLIPSIDVPVHQYFSEWDTPSHRDITIRHILTHSTGLECLPNTADIYEQDDFVQYALQAKPEHPPGQHFQYNNRQTNLLPAIVEKASGQPLEQFLREDLFGRLGITDFHWSKDKAGNPHGMSGLQILPEDFAAIGLLVLEGGKQDGELLLAESWFTNSFAPTESLPDTHGLLWWLHFDQGQLDYVKADGYLGQYLVLYPHLGIVGVRMYKAGLFHNFLYDQEVDGYDTFAADLKGLER